MSIAKMNSFQQGEKYHQNDTRFIAVDVDFYEETLAVTSPLLACDLLEAPERLGSS